MAKPTSNPGPVRATEKYAEYRSNDSLAKALRAKFPDIPWPENERSLGTQIGKLDKGQQVWWISHPANAKCLAELLDVSLADLGLHGPTNTSHTFSFDDFPELPPLDLKRDKIWDLATEQLDSNQQDSRGYGRETLHDWFKPALWINKPPLSMDWLYVADDLERQLLSKSLAATGNFEVVFVEALTDVGSRLLAQKPLIVSVRADGGDDDLTALAQRPENAGILVIAPFMLPVRKKTSSAEDFGWEQRTARGQERDNFELTAPGRPGFGKGMKRWTWTLVPDWRNRLLKWVEAYVNRHEIDTLFTEQEMHGWLDRFDPRGEWFCSTTDMMQLCRMGHYPGKKLPAATDPAAGNKLVTSLFSKETPSLSFQVKQLAEARWQRRELPWQGALSLETWLSLAPTSTAMVTRDDLNAIAQGKNSPERKKAADLIANRLEAGNPDALLASGLIKQQWRGYFDFQHRTLAGLVVRDSLMRQITGEPLASWALACFDNERRPMVDAALDAVSLLNLMDVAERLVQEAPDSAVAIGASEAMFMAVARRIGQGEAMSPAQILALMSIAQCVLGRLDLTTVDWAFPEPWSRPAESQDEKLEWITACWAWSLLPEAPVTMSENWLFPGWCTSLTEPPHWLTALWPDKDCEQLSSAWVSFFVVVDQWVKDLEQPITDAPRILRFAFLGKAAHGAWAADPVWWQDLWSLNDHKWVEEALLTRFKSERNGVAARLWPAFLAFERKKPNRYDLFSIRRWLLEQLSPADALDYLDEANRHYLASVPESLPPTFRAPLLQSLPKDSLKMGYCDALPFFTRFGPSAASALDGYLDHDILGDAAATCLWDWEPESAARLLGQKNDLSATAFHNLLWSCPASYVAVAAKVILAETTLLDWSLCLYWARKHLINAGSEAEHLVAIIKAAKHQADVIASEQTDLPEN